MKDWLLEFAKTPAGTAVCFGVFLVICLILLLWKCDFGKRTSKKAKLFAENSIRKVEENYLAIKKAKEELEKYEEEVNKRVDEKNAIVYEQNKKLEQLVYDISNNIHNEKVQKLVEDYKNESVDRINEISDVVAEKEKEYANEYEKKMDEIDTKIAEVDKILDELKNSPEISEKE